MLKTTPTPVCYIQQISNCQILLLWIHLSALQPTYIFPSMISRNWLHICGRRWRTKFWGWRATKQTSPTTCTVGSWSRTCSKLNKQVTPSCSIIQVKWSSDPWLHVIPPFKFRTKSLKWQRVSPQLNCDDSISAFVSLSRIKTYSLSIYVLRLWLVLSLIGAPAM